MADFKIEFYSELSEGDLAGSDTEGVIQNIISNNEGRNPHEIIDVLISENLIKQMDYRSVPHKIVRMVFAITNMGNYYIFIVKRDSDLDRGYCVFNAGDGTAVKSKNIAEHIAFKIKEVKQRGYFYAMPLEFRQSAQNVQSSSKVIPKIPIPKPPASKQKGQRKIVSYHPPTRHLPKPLSDKSEKKKAPKTRSRKKEDVIPWGDLDNVDDSKFPKILPKGERLSSLKEKSERKEENSSSANRTQKREEQWAHFYELLVAFKTEKGHCNVPVAYHPPLAAWVYRQRHKKQSLTPEQIEKLDGLGFEWANRSDETKSLIINKNIKDFFRKSRREKWQIKFEQLKAHYEQNGHSDLRPDDDPSLFNWARKQRLDKDLLSIEQIEALNSLHFDWRLIRQRMQLPDYKQPIADETPNISEQDWERNFERLKFFYENFNPETLKRRDIALAQWAAWLRQCRRKQELNEEQIKQLDEIEFRWVVEKKNKRQVKNWDKYYQLLQTYYQEHHTSEMPNEYDNAKLLVWIAKQRALFNRDELTTEQIEKLNAIGFTWVPKHEKWEERFEKLAEFYIQNGHCNIPKNHKLHKWVEHLLKKPQLISLERQKRLQAMGFTWPYKPNPEIDRQLDAFENFFKEHGHCNITIQNDPKLYAWLVGQRSRYKSGRLQPYVVERLRKLGIELE